MTNGMIPISPSSTFLTYVVIFQLHLHMVYIYGSLFYMQELVRHTIIFWFETVYWQTSWCHRGFNFLVYRLLSANFMVVTTILFAHTTFRWTTCCLICFIPIVKPFLTHWSCPYRLSNLEIGLTAGVTGQQGMLTPLWHLIPPVVFQVWFVQWIIPLPELDTAFTCGFLAGLHKVHPVYRMVNARRACGRL
jgi:hypothetical protein